jgi:hypothetical protein
MRASLAISNVITVAKGGTGITSYTIGDMLYASGATTLSKLADVAVGSVLVSGGVGVAPAWSNTPTISGAVTLTAGTASTSTTTGTLIVTGGVGVSGTLYTGDKITVVTTTSPYQLRLGTSVNYFDIGRNGGDGLLTFYGNQTGFAGYVFGGVDGTWLTISGAGNITATKQIVAAAGTTSLASLRVPHGSAPSSPVNGDIWTTTAGLFVRINGATVGPLS